MLYGPFAPTPNPGYPTLSYPIGFEEVFVDGARMLATIERLLVTEPGSSEKWTETAAPITAPAALTAALAGAGPGSVNNGAHSYVYTFVNGGSETIASPMSNIVTTSGGDGEVSLTNIATGPGGTTARKIYRSVAGNTGLWLLLATIADNSTTTYNDDIADNALGAASFCTFTTPVDSAGRFMSAKFLPGPVQINLQINDQNGLPVISTAANQRAMIINAGSTIHFYSCSKYIYISNESISPTYSVPGDHLGGGILTSFPEAEGGNGNYVYAHGSVNNTGGAEGYGQYLFQYFMLDNGGPAYAPRLINNAVDIGGTQMSMQMGTGSFKYDAPEMRANYSGANRFAGRMFNAYTCDITLAPGATRTLPIGSSGETGVFRVLPTQPATAAMRLMLRIA